MMNVIGHIYIYGACAGAALLLSILMIRPDAFRIVASESGASERAAMVIFIIVYILLWFTVPMYLIIRKNRK